MEVDLGLSQNKITKKAGSKKNAVLKWNETMKKQRFKNKTKIDKR